MTFQLDYLPGEFIIEKGTMDDYHQLARFHYRPKKPATVAGLWRVRYVNGDDSKNIQIVAVGETIVNDCDLFLQLTRQLEHR